MCPIKNPEALFSLTSLVELVLVCLALVVNGEFTALLFPTIESLSTALFDLVRLDNWGPIPILLYFVDCYYVSFIDA